MSLHEWAVSLSICLFVGPATTQNLVVKFDGEICGGVLVENASNNFPRQKKLEHLLANFAGSSPPIPPWKSLVLMFVLFVEMRNMGKGSPLGFPWSF